MTFFFGQVSSDAGRLDVALGTGDDRRGNWTGSVIELSRKRDVNVGFIETEPRMVYIFLMALYAPSTQV